MMEVEPTDVRTKMWRTFRGIYESALNSEDTARRQAVMQMLQDLVDYEESLGFPYNEANLKARCNA
mgnify:CR=1 FL=1